MLNILIQPNMLHCGIINIREATIFVDFVGWFDLNVNETEIKEILELKLKNHEMKTPRNCIKDYKM